MRGWVVDVAKGEAEDAEDEEGDPGDAEKGDPRPEEPPDDKEHYEKQGCQMAKFDPFLSLACARVEGVGHNPRKGRDQILQRSVAEP